MLLQQAFDGRVLVGYPSRLYYGMYQLFTCSLIYMFILQSELPASAENTVPLALILYTDKSKLSSFSTVKGYLVVVCCGNLPVNI